MSLEDTHHAVIPLMTCVLIDGTLNLGHGNCRGPRFGKRRRVVEGDLIIDRVRADAREALDHTPFLAGASEDSDVSVADRLQIGCLDDQSITFPTPTRVPQPLADVLTYVRPPVQGDDPRVVDHLDVNHHVSRSLQNLIIVVVEAGHHGAWQTARDAPLERAA